ncbi:MAG: hypothetical protein ACR2NR_21500 [Solirubrobacteraceae bacterium]
MIDASYTCAEVDYTVVVVAKLVDVSVSITGSGKAADGAWFSRRSGSRTRVRPPRPACSRGAGGARVDGDRHGWWEPGGVGDYWTTPSIGGRRECDLPGEAQGCRGRRGGVLIAAAAASTQVKDLDYATNAAGVIGTLGATSGPTAQAAARTRAHNPLAIGERLAHHPLWEHSAAHGRGGR